MEVEAEVEITVKGSTIIVIVFRRERVCGEGWWGETEIEHLAPPYVQEVELQTSAEE